MFFHLHYRNKKELLLLNLLNLYVESLTIRVETSRFRIERVCIFCENNCIEDEEHFLVKCPLYTNLKKKYFYMFVSEHFDNNQYLFITLVHD